MDLHLDLDSDCDSDPMTLLLDLLRQAATEHLAPEQMQRRLAQLRAEHPALAAELVWEREPELGTYHYDALVDEPGGTVSLAFCPDDAVPWPLRGVRRWADGDVVRVNETLLRIHDMIALVDFVWDQEPLVTTIVDACLLREAVAAAQIAPTDEDLQAAFDRFRERRGLFDADETSAWMARNGYTLRQMEHYMEDEARAQALRRRVTAGRVDEFLATRRGDLDLALLGYLEFDAHGAAARTAGALISGTAEFFALATARAALMRTAGRVGELPWTQSVLRIDLEPELRHAVFTAAPGAIVGPVARGGAFRVYRVLGISRCSDDEARARAERVLFDEWLAERRRAARVEWQWGRDAAA